MSREEISYQGGSVDFEKVKWGTYLLAEFWQLYFDSFVFCVHYVGSSVVEVLKNKIFVWN